MLVGCGWERQILHDKLNDIARHGKHRKQFSCQIMNGKRGKNIETKQDILQALYLVSMLLVYCNDRWSAMRQQIQNPGEKKGEKLQNHVELVIINLN